MSQYLFRFSPITKPSRYYKEYEMEVIEKIYPTWGAGECQKHIPWRSIDSIHKKAEKLKVKKVSSCGTVRSNKKWAKKEQDIINEYHAETEPEIIVRMKKIGCNKTIQAISTRIGETRAKLDAKKEDRKPWPNEHSLILATNIKCSPVELVKIFSKAGLPYTKKAITRKRRRMLNEHVEKIETITPLDHIVNASIEVSGVSINGEPLTIANGGLVETELGFEITKIIKPGDELKFI